MNFIEIFTRLLDDLRSVQAAEKEFMRHLDSDTEMAVEFDKWCTENGYRRRSEALHDLADEVIEQRESIWESLKDYDDEE